MVLRNAVWTYGRATSFARPLPGFLILGAQKAGTTALYAYLRWHPGITGPAAAESGPDTSGLRDGSAGRSS